MSNSLTPYELALVCDANILLAKNHIIQTVADLFGQLADDYRTELDEKFKFENVLINAKVSRGENYQGLPYVVLDYPRQFSKSDVFAIRTFFWWGNFFSITLQLAGEYQYLYAPGIQAAIDRKVFKDWYVSTGKSEWEHNFEEDNYRLIGAEDIVISDRPFLKIAKKIPLMQWDQARIFFIENFKLLTNVLQG